MDRIQALEDFKETVDIFSKYIDNSKPDSPVTISDDSFSSKEITNAVDAIDFLKAWLDKEIADQVEEDDHKLFLKEGSPGYEVGE